MNVTHELNMSKIPNELKLLLEIIKSESEVDNEHFSKPDWDLFLELALHHRLYPLLYTKIAKLDYSWIPKKVIKSLHIYYQQNTFRMLHLSGEMEKLCKLFTENKIRPLFLKGPILAETLYGDISKRTSGDLDILVPINDLDKANELLIAQGYNKDEYIQTVLNDWKWRHHHFTYFHPMKGTKIEIHWRLHPSPSKEPSFDELWERKRVSSLTSYPTYYMGYEDLFYFLITHGARHGWSRLRWLQDINQIMQKEISWTFVKQLLNQTQSSHIGGQSLILASALFNTQINEELIPLLRKRPKKLAKAAIYYLEQMVNLHNEPVPEDIAKYHSNHLFSLMSIQQKGVYFLSILHPFHTDVETLSLPKKLHFLYFPLRPFLWIWRKTKNYVLLRRILR
ncbi:nucleotidyltransferase family protein [Lederbergia wuyishanensis]|uniref:Renal dipeptidase n=1 Tax=Lederbergia wuyishanensis TaxID=1347903 RepID=A0ABU0D7S7_9BACI|nr:nucleotidyltransferase family protein [Lederbergia wuyishanensis]MCJ8009111.1 nucleotidyltransferase family protein [Lederbergia wuyishanensis]MDQ0344450.1 hypothetical protein [Lederbergia wuyishanensis]